MKIVFFRKLLLDDVTRYWTPSQQMVYSFLLSQSILRLDSVFHASGTNIDFKEVAEEYRDEDGEIDLCNFTVAKIVKSLNLSKQNVYDSLRFLNVQRYIRLEWGEIISGFIYFPKHIIQDGYFELKIETGLTKQLLIFYSWLHDKAYSYIKGKSYNGMIDTYSKTMADKFGTQDTNIRAMLSRLSDKGFVRRIKTKDRRYGKLLIL